MERMKENISNEANAQTDAPDMALEQQHNLVTTVFPCIMDIGEAMLKCGADVHTIEQTLIRVGKSYGAVRMNVLVITAVIIVTATYPGNYERTFSRRVVGEGGTDFAKLAAYSHLCNEICDDPLPANVLSQRLSEIQQRKISNVALYIGGVFSSGGFAMFFGGTFLDAIVSALFALLVCFSIKHFKPFTPNTIVFNFATALVSGIAICFVASFVPAINVNMIIIGVIMLLIPGIAMTNSTRDMLSGDTISGVMRFIESLLWATSLAIGFMLALWFSSAVGWAYDYDHVTCTYSLAAMIPIVLVSSLGFALFFNVSKRYIAIATLGGLVTWLIYYISSHYISGDFVPTLIASTVAAIYAEVLSRRTKVPNSAFFIIAVIPMVPGRGLYYTMYNAVNGNWPQCGSYALTTLLFAAGIAVGICLIAAIMQTWDIWSFKHKEGAKRIENAGRAVVGASKSVVHASKRAVKLVGLNGEPRSRRHSGKRHHEDHAGQGDSLDQSPSASTRSHDNSTSDPNGSHDHGASDSHDKEGN